MVNDADPITAIIFLGVIIFVYFIPTWIASARKHHNANAVFVTNLLLGWTFLGWVAAFIWSFTAVKKVEDSVDVKKQNIALDSKVCPFCAETIKLEAKVCRFCNRDLVEEAASNNNA